jgi:hypothetical protein
MACQRKGDSRSRRRIVSVVILLVISIVLLLLLVMDFFFQATTPLEYFVSLETTPSGCKANFHVTDYRRNEVSKRTAFSINNILSRQRYCVVPASGWEARRLGRSNVTASRYHI